MIEFQGFCAIVNNFLLSQVSGNERLTNLVEKRLKKSETFRILNRYMW